MSAYQFANDAQTTTTGTTLIAATTVNVVSTASFSAAAQYIIRLDDGAFFEYCLVTAAPGGTSFTVTRAQEGTSARQFLAGTTVTQVVTAGTINSALVRLDQVNTGEVAAADFKITGVPGLTGAGAGRMIGNWTTQGAPTGFTPVAGDFGIDQTSTFWVYDGNLSRWKTVGHSLLQGTSGGSANYTISAGFSGFSTIVIHYKVRSNDASNSIERIFLRLNGDATANYDYQETFAAGTTTTSSEGLATAAPTIGFLAGGGLTNANMYAVGQIIITSFADTNNQKLAEGRGSVSRGDNVSGSVYIGSWTARWRSTSAVTSIGIYPGGGSFSANSWAYFYGLP